LEEFILYNTELEESAETFIFSEELTLTPFPTADFELDVSIFKDEALYPETYAVQNPNCQISKDIINHRQRIRHADLVMLKGLASHLQRR